MIFFTLTEFWQLAALQLLFYLFLVLGIGAYLFWRREFFFVGLVSIIFSLSFLIISFNAILPWWGLTGDEIFIFAFLEKVRSGGIFADFFYSGLPPFYPPFYFWVVGLLAKVFGLTAIKSGFLGVVLILFAVPWLIYFWLVARGEKNFWLLVLLPTTVYVVSSWSAIIVKPYEFISAVLLIFWTIFLIKDISERRIDRKSIIFYGLTGGVLFLTFYFWFLIILLALGFCKLAIKTDLGYFFKNWFLVGSVILIVSLPFTLPLVISYLNFGAENWQPAWFIEDYLDLYLPFFDLSIFGATALLGLISLVWLKRKIEIKVLSSILLACYVWQGISLLTIYFWDAPFLPAKPFLFLGGATLSVAAAYGLTTLAVRFKNESLKAVFFIGIIFLFASQSIFSPWLAQEIKLHLNLMNKPLREEFQNLKNNLERVSGLEDLTVLSSGTPEMSAFVPLDYYVSYNVHFSHPAANFSTRYYFIRNLSQSFAPDNFYHNLKNSPLGKIDALLLLKGDGYYPINFYIDNYPLGGQAVEIHIPASLIDEQYFVKVFEDKQFVFLKVKD